MINLVQITDFEDRGIERLLSQFRNKVRIEALIKAVCEAVQTVEDLNYDLIDTTTFENAAGVHLDTWGELVGESRDGFSDTDYRTFISARILVNNSEGTADELIHIFDIIEGDGVVRMYHLIRAGFELYTYRSAGDLLTDQLRAKISRMMRSVKPAGVSMELIEVPDGYFGWGEDPEALGFDVGIFAEVF